MVKPCHRHCGEIWYGKPTTYDQAKVIRFAGACCYLSARVAPVRDWSLIPACLAMNDCRFQIQGANQGTRNHMSIGNHFEKVSAHVALRGKKVLCTEVELPLRLSRRREAGTTQKSNCQLYGTPNRLRTA